MTLIHKAVTFDCTDATVVSQFWSAVLGRPVDADPMPPSPFFASIGLGDSSRIAYMFIQVPEGKAVKNRVHLDLDADDVAGEVARVISHGATHIHDKEEFGMQWTTLADPEGNEFCIGTPHHG
jgi:predicted enzyme related to lactoylglutathione lyase